MSREYNPPSFSQNSTLLNNIIQTRLKSNIDVLQKHDYKKIKFYRMFHIVVVFFVSPVQSLYHKSSNVIRLNYCSS